jgi:hypothetical protein
MGAPRRKRRELPQTIDSLAVIWQHRANSRAEGAFPPRGGACSKSFLWFLGSNLLQDDRQST